MAGFIQSPLASQQDLRMMLRNHVGRRCRNYFRQSRERRRRAIQGDPDFTYCETIREWVRISHGFLPVGAKNAPLESREVSRFEKSGYRIENHLFTSFPGWEVNATVYRPLDFDPPFPAIVVPVGHSGKQFESYQLPCQFFARCGFLTITFDPPGQLSEKRPGNDHFRDGVRPYLFGQTSNRYFVADALRCIDYLETREDANLSAGVAMTGVSGGGTTTIFANLIDDRIAVTGPSCCLSPLEPFVVDQAYSACPEGRMWQRFSQGVDNIDLICAGAPKPVLVMAGAGDEIFRKEDVEALAAEAKSCYQAQNAGKQYDFYLDEGGHAYSLAQARRFVEFLDQHFLSAFTNAFPKRIFPDPDTLKMNPETELQCKPRQDVNMFTLALEDSKYWARKRRNRGDSLRDRMVSAAQLNGELPSPLQWETTDPFRTWVHDFRSALLSHETDIEIPATLVTPADGTAAPLLFHLDDGGRNRLLEAGGPLTKAIRLVDRENPTFGVFAPDLRGWGDSRPALFPYEIASWGSTARYFAYTTNALGDNLMMMRVRDAFAAYQFLKEFPSTVNSPIILSGCGLGGVVATLLAPLLADLQGLVLWESLDSFQTLLESEYWSWDPAVFIPEVLCHFDLPEIREQCLFPVLQDPENLEKSLETLLANADQR